MARMSMTKAKERELFGLFAVVHRGDADEDGSQETEEAGRIQERKAEARNKGKDLHDQTKQGEMKKPKQQKKNEKTQKKRMRKMRKTKTMRRRKEMVKEVELCRLR